ncbi:MAG TPA: ABC transporter substrate-binding protein, partial [Anaerolineales bacterium]|nr:ABC transporter substrate-binding protein [Anaerolineales bacterium]
METIDHTQAQEFLHMRKIDLAEDQLRALQAHLSACADCRQYAASLENLQGKLATEFHNRWDAAQPVKSRSAGVLIRWGRDTMKTRILRYAGTAISVLVIIGLIIGLDFVIRNLRPQPAVQPPASTATSVSQGFLPSPTGIVSPSITSIPSATTFPEGTILLNWGYAIIPPDPDSESLGDQWAKDLSAASGLNVVAVPGPTTNLEILEALRDGKIQMAEVDSLTFIYGQSQGWIVPGPVVNFPHTPSGSIMFVARTDSGLVKGEPPQVLEQLAGRRPCWPAIDKGWHMSRPPIYEYVLPMGLLAEAGIQLGEPVYVTYTESHRDNATEVFLKECDFAVVQAIPEEYYLMQWAPYLGSLGYTIDDWATQMQVLYTTPEIEPYRIMAFSSQLETSKRDLLTNAFLSVPSYSTRISFKPYDADQKVFFDRYQELVTASGVSDEKYVSLLWDEYLLGLVNASQVSSPTAEPTKLPSTRTLTICMGAEPDTLDIYQGNMLAASNVLEAIYDGPIDTNSFSYQPVILEKLPSLADGDAFIQPVSVKENYYVVNDAGEVVLLQPGQVVRPYGCNLSSCAITWQGGPLEMAQMSATFTLIPDIRWSDGEPLTADDSVFGFEVATSCRLPEDPNVGCGTLGATGRSAMAKTASYTALDEYTTQWVGLPGFFNQTYMTNFAHPLPRHLMNTKTPAQIQDILANKPMGWGAYKIDRWMRGAYIQLSKNPYYFRANEGLPYFDQLTIRFLSGSEELMVDAIRNGGCDILDQEAGQAFFGDTSTLNHFLELNASGQIKGLISTGTT